uniref:Uncharacterized LOC105915493 n=1 Tax=Fundulus heteroclitus TaxID=8078 RepID=A0A3Q2P0X0_FUNHE
MSYFQLSFSKAFTDCTIEDAMYNGEDTMDISFEPYFSLCCKTKSDCALCLVVESEVSIPVDNEVEKESHSGTDEEEDEYTRNEKSSMTVCYQHVASNLPMCKKVEFTVNYTTLELNYTTHQMSAFKFIPVYKEDYIELQIVGNTDIHTSLCVKYEKNGHCRTTIPLYSVAHCMCIQAWDESDEKSIRSQSCPFERTGLPSHLQNPTWKNVSVNVRLAQLNDGSAVLLWNLTAPCRLDGEVSLHGKPGIPKGGNERKQRFAAVNQWKQNSEDHWERQGAFQNVDERISQCVMVKYLFLFSLSFPDGRWHWTLLVVGIMLLVCLTTLMIYFLRDYVKKWVWSWRHGGFVKIGRKGHVVLLSPPDVDNTVSEMVCQLGSQLCCQGFSVSVDQWCRKDQCTMGPLPWLYSQLQKLDNMGGRVVLVITQKALQKTEEWTLLNNDGEVREPQLMRSPYSDLFTALLFIIYAHKKLGRAAQRFVLVKVDSHQTQSHIRDNRLPELLQGLPLFLLPSQRQRWGQGKRQLMIIQPGSEGWRQYTTNNFPVKKGYKAKFIYFILFRFK